MEKTMRIAHGDEVPIDCGSSGVRTGKIGRQYLLSGDPESPGNFKFGLFHQYGDFFSPRHRHNFCQIRFQLEGDCAYGLDGKLTPGTLGFFPEGTYYGPQGPDRGDTYTATLQFGGPSGQGLLTLEQTAAAKRELAKIGVFEQGVFRRNSDVDGKKNVDGFQAVWEQVAGRKLVYPEPQYAAPILMHLDNFKWMPLAGKPGVSIKALGTFTDCDVPCAAYRLEPGADFVAESRGVYMVLSGGGSLAGESFRRYTSLYIDTGETARFKADQVSEILLMGMPNVADMQQHGAAEPHSEVAE
jgi:hypothetical protein